MKKVIIVGVLVVAIVLIVLGFQENKKSYEYYDLSGNYGTSLKCRSDKLVECEIGGEMIEVSQYSAL